MPTRSAIRRVLIAAGLATAAVLSLAGCPSSGSSEPVCKQSVVASPGDPDNCPDTGR
ncbi:hypothetical protein [Actinoplanes awajinensis]|uniref:hypothetical protein n=1 Tax=Actinoplanes awajinensis TaxID=135946 RepID=UPI0012FA0A87|nr:hypothetical protein [Actinoplanes awajinensis]